MMMITHKTALDNQSIRPTALKHDNCDTKTAVSASQKKALFFKFTQYQNTSNSYY